MRTEARIIRWNITDDERELGKRLLYDYHFCEHEFFEGEGHIRVKTGLVMHIMRVYYPVSAGKERRVKEILVTLQRDNNVSTVKTPFKSTAWDFIYHTLVKEHRRGKNA